MNKLTNFFGDVFAKLQRLTIVNPPEPVEHFEQAPPPVPMRAYRVQWANATGSGEYTGIYPHQAAAIRTAITNKPGARVCVRLIKR